MSDYRQHLAVASVPMQSWSQIYNENDALKNGTIFPELNMPFFVTVEADEPQETEDGGVCAQRMREDMLLEIQKVSFVVDDVRLYMDTHPGDTQGLALLKSTLKRRRELLKEYALQFYPLTMDCMADVYQEMPDSDCYCWQNGPCPWEGACV